jgi:hypothetical protein
MLRKTKKCPKYVNETVMVRIQKLGVSQQKPANPAWHCQVSEKCKDKKCGQGSNQTTDIITIKNLWCIRVSQYRV